MSTKKGNVRAAIDAAALASVIPAHFTDTERANFAQEVFDKNYDGNLEVALDIGATRERVDIEAVSKVPTLFSKYGRRKRNRNGRENRGGFN